MSIPHTIYEKLFRRKQQIHNDYAYVFGTPEGKRVLAHICEMAYMSQSTFNPKIPEKTILNEGSRLLALAILKHVNIEPSQLIQHEGETYNL